MSRETRKFGSNGVYHCMLRGINKQDIFFDTKDHEKMIKVLGEAKGKYGFEIFAYVLMPNHVHLEIKDVNNMLSQLMHSIAVRYASYFNKKYERVGYVFQDRYNSKPIENDVYLLNLQRYIHKNPEKAGIAKASEYRWTSYQDYINNSGITDIERVLNLIKNDTNCLQEDIINEFIKFNERDYHLNEQEILEYEMKMKFKDEELTEIITNVLKIKIEDIQNVQRYTGKQRDEILEKIVKLKGTNIKQISRVLGINKKVIQRIANKIKKDINK